MILSLPLLKTGLTIGRDTIIYPMTVIHADVRIGKNCSIGPMARLRPGTRISDGVEIGNFAEVSQDIDWPGGFSKAFFIFRGCGRRPEG